MAAIALRFHHELRPRTEEMDMENQFARIDSIQVRYRQSARKGAPVVVMTNAWPQSLRCWDSHWSDLASEYHLLAYDMPGFGLSEGKKELMSPSAQSDFLLRLVDHFEIQSFYGIGPDVGLPVMLSFAEKYPERIEGLTIFNGPGFYPPDVSWELGILFHSRVVRAVTAYFGRAFARVAMARGYRNFQPEPSALAEYETINRDPARFRLTLDFLGSYPAELAHIGENLDKIAGPVQVLWGEKDPFLSVRNAHRLAERIPSAQLRILKGCGHFAHEDAGPEFTELVRSHQQSG
ncbi:MAG: alpha/beta hydrolase [Deltaproteobacteria bacterium]|nr:alpha/beta hydrolase [Deltaproteobacteria bacterium]